MATPIFLIFTVALAFLSFPENRLCKANDTSVKGNSMLQKHERYIRRNIEHLNKDKDETSSRFHFHRIDLDTVGNFTSKNRINSAVKVMSSGKGNSYTAKNNLMYCSIKYIFILLLQT